MLSISRMKNAGSSDKHNDISEGPINETASDSITCCTAVVVEHEAPLIVPEADMIKVSTALGKVILKLSPPNGSHCEGLNGLPLANVTFQTGGASKIESGTFR